MVDFRVVILFCTAAIYIAFTILVYVSGPRTAVNLVFCVFMAGMTYWALSLAMFLLVDTPAASLFWARVIYMAGPLIGSAFLHLSFILPDGSFRPWQLSLYVPTVLLLLGFCATPWLLAGVAMFDGTKGFLYGPLRPLWDAHFAATFGLGFYRFFKAQAAATGIKRMRILYVLWGTLAGFAAASVTNVIMTWFNRFELIWIGPLLTLIWVVFLVYGVTRYRLLDIRAAVMRLVLFGMLYALAIGIVVTLLVAGRSYLTALFGADWWVVPFVMLAGLSSLVPILYHLLRARAEARLFRTDRAYQTGLQEIAHELAGFTDLESRCHFVGGRGAERMELDFAELSAEGRGLSPDVRVALNRWPVPATGYAKHLMAEELADRSQPQHLRALGAWMADKGASVLVPGRLQGELIACLILGPKRSGAIYTAEDFDALEALVRHSALIIKNLGLLAEVHEHKRLAEFGEMTTAINHEFNNIFTILSGTLELVALKLNDPSLRQTVRALQEDIGRGQHVVRATAAYRSNLRTPPQSWPLAAVLADALARAQQDGFANAKPRFTVTTSVPEHLSIVGQATIPELFSNALRCLGWACEGRTGSLRIYASWEASVVQLKFAMSGGADLRATIEKAGALAPEPGRHGGLYYFLAKLIAADHRGSLAIESTPGGGTTLIIRLPQEP
jgi:hypothetical protein